jgi:hypothetical protein
MNWPCEVCDFMRDVEGFGDGAEEKGRFYELVFGRSID